MSITSKLEEYKPLIVQISCQIAYAGVTLSSRVAFVEHMSPSVFVVYRQTIAYLLLAPFAFSNRRAAKRDRLGWKNFWLIFLLAFIGVTVYQNLNNEGLYLSSSSAASAMGNSVPAITLIMAFTMGLEKLNPRSIRTAAKITGIILCVAGGASMALFKGPKLLNMEFHPANSLFNFKAQDTWLLGCSLLFASYCCFSFWLMLQGYISSSYPDHLAMTAWMSLFAATQSAVLTLMFERDTQAWKITSPVQLFSCLYAGLVSAITNYAQAWCISKRGPLFSAMFNPLCTVIVTVFACLFMHEEMYTGSLAGAVAVVIGLYIVLWGKAKDKKLKEEKVGILPEKIDLEAPLLHKETDKSQDDDVQNCQ